MAQRITVDLTPNDRTKYRRPTLYFSQGDAGRPFEVNISSRFGTDIPTGATAKIQATKPSGFGFSVTADSLTDGIAYFTSTAGMADEHGKFSAEISFSKDGVILGTDNIDIEIQENPHPDGTTDGEAEQVIPQLTQLVERIETAADSIHDLSVEAVTLAPNTPATATYDETNNKITFGIPRGAQLMAADDGDGNITLTFS